VLGVLALDAFGVAPAVVLLVLAAVAVVDLVVVQRRRAARSRAHERADHRHDSLFE
jgi:Tfp pilus assembly protein PilX